MRLIGWKVDPQLPEGAHRCVLVAAPHTSNWDGFFMILASLALGLRFRFAIKREWLRFPMGLLLRPLGAIGIDRRPKHADASRLSQVEAMVELFQVHQQLTFVIAPEGSRALSNRWRTGFYYVALQAQVPIALGYLDYARKIAGIGPSFHPTGDLDADLAHIQSFYRNITPRYPERSLVGASPAPSPSTSSEDPS